MKKSILTLALFCLALSISAQQRWTLRQCIDYAVENNIEIKQQALKVDNAEIEVSTAKNSRLPNLNASIDPTFNFQRIPAQWSNTETSDLKYEGSNSFGTGMSVGSSVPLFTGFQIPNEKKAKEFSLLAATADLQKARENLELQVASLYLEVLFKKELVNVNHEQLSLTSKQLDRTIALVEAGKLPRSQEYDVLSQQAKDELNVVMAQNDLDLSLLNLAQALNIQSESKFDIAEPEIGNSQIEANKSSILPPSEIYAMAISVKPHVRVAEYDLESSRKNLAVARSGYYPTLDLNLGYGTRYGHNFGKDNKGFTSQIRDLGSQYIGLSLKIPLFDRFQTRNRVRTAQLNITDRELVLDNVKLSLYKEIQQAYQSATAARSKFTSTEKAYQAAEESYKYAEQRYEIGKSSVFEFNEAQTKLLTSKSEQIQAKYDFLFRAKILDFYRGVEIDIQ